MFEWWQALLLSVSSLAIGGLIALLSGYAQHRWAERAARSAEKRADERAMAEERREAIREARRDRLQRVFEFLDLAKRYAAWSENYGKLEQKFDETDLADFPEGTSASYVKSEVQKIWGMPSVNELWVGFYVAISTTSSESLINALANTLSAVLRVRNKDDSRKASDAIRDAETAVEKAIADS